MIVKSEFLPLFNDFSNNGNLKIEKILEFFEHSGGFHSDKVGNSISKMLENGKSWVLNDWNIKILKYPKNGDKIEISTWILPSKSPLFSIREYELRVGGKLFVVGSSKWLLFDLINSKICKIDKNLIDMYGPENLTNFDENAFAKIENLQIFDKEIFLNIRKSDIDINNHVHNTLYVSFAYEVLPNEIFVNLNFSEIKISYKNGIKYGENIICKYKKYQNSHIVVICDDKNNLKAIIKFV